MYYGNMYYILGAVLIVSIGYIIYKALKKPKTKDEAVLYKYSADGEMVKLIDNSTDFRKVAIFCRQRR